MTSDTLPNFEVVEVDGKWGTLRCPRRQCKGVFKVVRKKFKEPWEIRTHNTRGTLVEARGTTKPCPYCFVVAKIPGT